jgi:glucokinase
MELNPNAHFAVGVNIRPTFVEAVLMDLIGSIRAETILPLQGGREPEDVIDTVIEATGQVIRLAEVDSGRVLGVGVGCPGPVTGGRTVIGIPGFPWSCEALADRLEASLGLPVILENDANCGALAEFRHGACSDIENCECMVFLYVDYGVGAGIIIDGNIYRGADGTAGEIGHTIIDPTGPQCLCGNVGCLEAVASVESLVRRAMAAHALGGRTEQREGDWESVSFEAIMEAVEANDGFASNALDEALDYLAIGVTNVSRTFRPNMIVLGGYMFERGYSIAERLQEAIAKRPDLFGMTPRDIVVSKLGGKACTIGAGTLVLENFFGVAQQVMAPAATSQLPEPSFESTPIWPQAAAYAAAVQTSTVRLESAGNLQPALSRVRAGDPISITVDVRLQKESRDTPPDVKVLLHWDRVALYGGHWATPKNSPMRLISEKDGVLRYGVTLGSLPSGRYEFAAHVLGKNDIWVRIPDEHGESNGRVEVLPSRAAADRQEHEDDYQLSGKEAERPKALVEG